MTSLSRRLDMQGKYEGADRNDPKNLGPGNGKIMGPFTDIEQTEGRKRVEGLGLDSEFSF